MVVASTRDKLATHAPFLLHPPLPLLLLLFSLVQSVKCKRDQSADASVGPQFSCFSFSHLPRSDVFLEQSLYYGIVVLAAESSRYSLEKSISPSLSLSPSLLLLKLLVFHKIGRFGKRNSRERKCCYLERKEFVRGEDFDWRRCHSDHTRRCFKTLVTLRSRIKTNFPSPPPRYSSPFSWSTGNLILFLPLVIFVILRTIISSCNYTVKLCKGIYLSIFQRPS